MFFVQGINAQPKPYQESLISIVHEIPYYTGQPFPKDIVKIYCNYSILFINEEYRISDNPFNKEKIEIVDSTSIQIEKVDFFKLAVAVRGLNPDSLYIPKEKRDDGLEISIMGVHPDKYIIKTSNRTFTIYGSVVRCDRCTEPVMKFLWLIADIEGKYKPGK
ncbi:MAG: hypothetical protein DRJ05_11105 [Bacteroidetes bacterium]|nr:MAG: hypothetical protein DRJ05_11105 [Bacteroidota bacterium]